MRLYLNADSKKNIGYTPDWLKVVYTENEIDFELTLDIQGEIDYDNKSLNCRCKGDLIPWVLCDLEDGDETDLSELSEEECDELFPVKKIAEIICNGSDHRIGIFPVKNDDKTFELAEDDELTNCEAYLEMYDGENDYEHHFIFETELNIY